MEQDSSAVAAIPLRQQAICWFKRPQVWGFFVSVAIMAIISIAFFAPDNFEGNSLRQHDMQQGLANGHEVEAYHEATGEKPLWTNSLFGGMPTFQIAPSYPSNSLFSWLDSVYGLGLPAPSNLLFMMMAGFFILMYTMKVRWPLALLGAVAWGFSSYYIIIIGAGHIWKFLALTYIPPTIGGLVLAYRRNYLGGGAMMALFAMLQLNANHPQMSYYFSFVMAAMAIAHLITAIRGKHLKQWAISTGVCIAAGLLAIGANLPSLYNTYEYSKETKRNGSELTPKNLPEIQASDATKPTGGMPYGEIIGWSYGKSETFSLLIPNVKGGATARPEQGQMKLMGLDRLPSAQKYAGGQEQMVLSQFPQYFNEGESTNGPVYVGAVICALFILGCIIVRGPMKWALLTVTILSILLSWGRNFEALTQFMVYNFPMYNKFRAVESILVIAEFTIPLLAVLGLKEIFSDNEKNKWGKYRNKILISFGIPMLICAAGILSPGIFGNAITSDEAGVLSQYPDYYNLIESLRLGMVRSDSLRSFVYLALGMLCIWSYMHYGYRRSICAGLLTAIVLFDLYTVDKRYISHDSFCDTMLTLSDPFEPDAIDRQILADTTLHYRIIDIPGFGSAHRSYLHKRLGGYHAAKLTRYEDLIQRRMGYALNYGYIPELRDDSIMQSFPVEGRPTYDALRADYKVLDMLNARYIIDIERDGQDKQYLTVKRNGNALGNAWFVGHVEFVDNADEEMSALATLDPATEAVADNKFRGILNESGYVPAPGDTIYLTSYSPARLEYHAVNSTPATAVFSEVYFPWGWKATIDGNPAELARVNYVLRALQIPAGEHEITMHFDPDSLHATGHVAYACVTIIYLLIIAAVAISTRRVKCKD